MDAPDAPSDQIQSELENFRKEWRAEVSARAKNPTSASSQTPQPGSQAGSSSSSSRPPPRRSEPSSHKRAVPSTKARNHQSVEGEDEDEDDVSPRRSFDGGEPEPTTGHRLGGGGGIDDRPKDTAAVTKGKDKDRPPQTALDFYEAAVEKETTGKLGDSLQLYRRAFRMDSEVDSTYKNKYFASSWRANPPPASSASTTPTLTGQTNPAPNAPPASAPAPASAEGPTATSTATPPPPPLSLPELIASFAGTTIQGVPPEVEGATPPPCPIAALPDEILVHVLRDVAVADVGDFVRLARVCRRLAYLVATEDQIWRRGKLVPLCNVRSYWSLLGSLAGSKGRGNGNGLGWLAR